MIHEVKEEVASSATETDTTFSALRRSPFVSIR